MTDPRKTKSTGYLVKIEVFAAADLGDIAALQTLQKKVQQACDQFAGSGPSASVTATRR